MIYLQAPIGSGGGKLSLTTSILVMIMLLWVSVRTISYALWIWRNGNKIGSFMVIFVCLASVALPVYVAFFKT